MENVFIVRDCICNGRSLPYACGLGGFTPPRSCARHRRDDRGQRGVGQNVQFVAEEFKKLCE